MIYPKGKNKVGFEVWSFISIMWIVAITLLILDKVIIQKWKFCRCDS